MFFPLLFISCVFGASVVRDDGALFYKIDKGECVYIDKYSVIYEGGDFSCYTSKDCSGDEVSNEADELACALLIAVTFGESDAFVEKDVPNYAGFVSEFADEAGCPNERYILREYLKSDCTKIEGGSSKGVEENGKLIQKLYTSSDCSGEPIENREIGTCDACHADNKYVQCGTISNLILLAIVLIAFLF